METIPLSARLQTKEPSEQAWSSGSSQQLARREAPFPGRTVFRSKSSLNGGKGCPDRYEANARLLFAVNRRFESVGFRVARSGRVWADERLNGKMPTGRRPWGASARTADNTSGRRPVTGHHCRRLAGRHRVVRRESTPGSPCTASLLRSLSSAVRRCAWRSNRTRPHPRRWVAWA